MKPIVTHEGVVELGLARLSPAQARHLGLELFHAADTAYMQAARNYSFTTRARTTT